MAKWYKSVEQVRITVNEGTDPVTGNTKYTIEVNPWYVKLYRRGPGPVGGLAALVGSDQINWTCTHDFDIDLNTDEANGASGPVGGGPGGGGAGGGRWARTGATSSISAPGRPTPLIHRPFGRGGQATRSLGCLSTATLLPVRSTITPSPCFLLAEALVGQK